MTYNVFGGMLNLTQSVSHGAFRYQPMNQIQPSPVMKCRHDSTVDCVDVSSDKDQADKVDSSGRVVDHSGHSERMLGVKPRSSVDGSCAAADVDNVVDGSCREVAESRPVSNNHGTSTDQF